MAVRPGFLIPNANTYAPDYQTAQPDAGDFLVMGNTSTGVVTGCEVTFSGLSASLGSGPHIIVIDGTTYIVTGNTSVSIPGKGSLPRWDLIVFDSNNGGFGVASGVPAANPVYADITDSMVVLAAIFVPVTGGNDPHCIDKRNFLSRSVVGAATDPSLLESYDGITPRFKVSGAGKSTWGPNDTTLEETSPGVLRVNNELDAGILRADTEATVNGFDVVTADRIQWGHGVKPVVGNDVGDLWVDDESGDISVWLPSGWSAGYTSIPTGTIIMSMNPPNLMAGWLPLWGGTYSQFQSGNLWAQHPEWISGGLLHLPDLRGRFPVGGGTGSGAPGDLHGTVIGPAGAGSAVITVDQLPSHSHQVGPDTGPGGGHAHTGTAQSGGAIGSLTTNAGGSHNHDYWDPGHVHTWSQGWPMVDSPYGDSSIDNLFPDDEHHGTMGPSLYSDPAGTGLFILEGGVHQHTTPPIAGHTHSLTTDAVGAHTHPAPAHSAVGGGQPVTFTPPSISINYYIKI